MLRFLWLLLNIKPSPRAQAMTEYILIIAVISVAVITVLIAFRAQLYNLFNYVIAKLGGQSNPTLEQEEPASPDQEPFQGN